MKRFLFILLGLSVIAFPVFSQLGTFSQRGRATQEMTTGGFSAAHNNIPLNSTVTITNTVNGKTVEVTITGRILMSSRRIIDLSANAWNALELSEDTIVALTYNPVLPAVEPAPDIVAITADAAAQAAAAHVAAVIAAAQAEAQAQAEAIISAARSEANAILNSAVSDANVILNAGRSEAEVILSSARSEADVILNTARSEAGAADQSQSSETVSAAPRTEDEPPAAPRRTSFPVDIAEFDEEFFEWLIAIIVKPNDILVLPHMPDPDSDSLYRLQIGSFRQTVNADRAERLVTAMGFQADREVFNEFTRIFINNISAKEALYAVQRLGVVGFRTIWVREHP